MGILDSHFRGSTAYFESYKALIRAAREHNPATYKLLMEIMKLKPGNYAQAQVGIMLGEISEDTVRAGLPMLSAVVVGTETKRPSEGFFQLAVELGRLPAGCGEAQKMVFWESELQRVYKAKWPSSAMNLKRKA